jgi:hypothetical protein
MNKKIYFGIIIIIGILAMLGVFLLTKTQEEPSKEGCPDGYNSYMTLNTPDPVCVPLCKKEQKCPDLVLDIVPECICPDENEEFNKDDQKSDAPIGEILDDVPVGCIPFDEAPTSSSPNCDAEQRFKFDGNINSQNEFITLLKKYQYEGEMKRPTKEGLIPSEVLEQKIRLDKFTSKVTIETSKSDCSNEKFFSLIISDKDFSESGWPWQIVIKISETGYISIKQCAGI